MRVEHEERAGGTKGLQFASVPQPTSGVTSRCVTNGSGFGIEHDNDHRDELFAAIHFGELLVEFFEGLCRVAELAEEDAEQVLGLEGSDRAFDAMTAHVANDGGEALVAHSINVEEVAGHQARASFVGSPHVEAGDIGERVGGETGRPRLRREVFLFQCFLSALLEEEALTA